MTAKTYDSKSYDLAERFLEDTPSLNTGENRHELALEIQTAIEDFIAEKTSSEAGMKHQYKHNPHEWHLEHRRDGYYVINEHGEEIAWASEDYPNAKLVLHNLITDELAAQQDNGPDDPPGLST